MSTVEELTSLIGKKGDEIRNLKANGADKEALLPHINELKDLKER